MNNELLNLKNLGKASTRWLRAVGVHNATGLRRLGSMGAYRATHARGLRASKILLYTIEDTLFDVHWNELSPDHEIVLLGELETFPMRNKS